MHCELCGKEKELVYAIIEGVELKVCNDCARHGKVLIKPKPIIKKSRIETEMPMYDYVENFAQLIKKKREELGLRQEELAIKINERTSLVHKIESGQMKPSLDVAKKLEKFFGIKIIKELKEEKVSLSPTKTKEFTIGDLIKFKK